LRINKWDNKERQVKGKDYLYKKFIHSSPLFLLNFHKTILQD
jgi:hypothetical protein